MAEPLPDDPIHTSFEDALICLYDEVGRFLRAHPHLKHLDREECVSMVFESFVKAYYGHNPAKGSFLRRVRFLARHEITDYLRRERNKIKPIQDSGALGLLAQKSSFRLDEFVRQLSPDANSLVWVARHLDTKGMEEGWSPERKRDLLWKTMLEKGWNGDRILAASLEVTQAWLDWEKEK